MPYEVRLLQLSPSMDDGTVTAWLKKEGDQIEEGEELYEVESDKVSAPVKSPATGVVHQLTVKEGENVQVGALLAILALPGDKLDAPAAVDQAESTAGASPPPVAAPVSAAPRPEPSAPRTGRIFVSPRARRVAKELGVDPTTVTGTGPGGRVLERDVIAASKEVPAAPVAPAIPAPAAVPMPGGFEVVGLTGMRKAIADRMHHSKSTTAPVTLTSEVDMSEVAKLRSQINTEWESKFNIRVSYTDVIVRAVTKALGEHPAVNASLVDQEIRRHKDINVGVAVALDDGLIVPNIPNADQKSLLEISTTLRELAGKARDGSLSHTEVTGGTFTITNLGTYGVEAFTPIINHPECAILGVGRIADRAVVRDGEIVIRPTMWLSLTFDHRIVDGAPAAQFLARVQNLLESPYLLFV